MAGVLSPWAKIGSWLSNNWASFSIVQVVGRTDAPKLEKRIRTEQASYGKQLGALSDVVALLVTQSDKVVHTSEAHKFLAMKRGIDALKAGERTQRISRLVTELESLLDQEAAEDKSAQVARNAIARAKHSTAANEPA